MNLNHLAVGMLFQVGSDNLILLHGAKKCSLCRRSPEGKHFFNILILMPKFIADNTIEVLAKLAATKGEQSLFQYLLSQRSQRISSMQAVE